MLVAVAVGALDPHAGNRRHLAVLVPREHHHHVHFPALQLVDAGVGVGDELEEQRRDARLAAALPQLRAQLVQLGLNLRQQAAGLVRLGARFDIERPAQHVDRLAQVARDALAGDQQPIDPRRGRLVVAAL